MPVIVCPQCNLQMKPVQTGQVVELMSTFGPYKLQMADRYGCPSCKAEVLTGIGSTALAENFQSDYVTKREQYNASDGPVVQYWADQHEKAVCKGTRLDVTHTTR